MTAACPAVPEGVGLIRGVLGAVDCNVRTFSQAGYQALTAPQSIFPAALTVLLTIYVAELGYRLMFGVGGTRLADAPLIGLKVGGVLAISLGWSAFQTLVFNLAMDGPIEIARIVGAPATDSGAALAADPVGGLQTAYDQLVLDAATFAKAAGPNPQALQGGPAMAAQGLWRASSALFLSTAGVLTLAEVYAGVLTAIGPLFIALFLFDATRGLFVGWVRALAAAAITPLVCWVGTEILLVVLEPWLLRLAQQREAGAMNPDTAEAATSVVFVFAIAQLGLLSAGGMIAGGFNPLPARVRREISRQIQAAEPGATVQTSRAQSLGRRLEAEGMRDPANLRAGVSGGRAADPRAAPSPRDAADRLGGEGWSRTRRTGALRGLGTRR